MTTIYFPDTNFFLQFRKASELPWNELLTDCPGTIELLIPATVVTELDNQKRKGDGRKQRRAREVSAEIRKADLDSTRRCVVREKNPRILQGSPPVLPIDYSQWPVLDRTNPDHQIVAQVATYIAKVGPACILTDDTNMAQIARELIVPVLYLPDSWELQPEPDAQAQKIVQLEAEVKQLKNARPEVDIQVLSPEKDAIVTELSVPLKDYGRTEGVVDRVVAKIQAMYPMETEFPQTREESRPAPKITGGLVDLASLKDFGMPWIPPSETDIKDYQEADYPRWLSKVREHVKQLATKLSIQARTYDFTYAISNNGFANAEMVQLHVRAFDGFLLSRGPDDDEDNEDENAPLPQPPAPPKGRVGMAGLYAFARVQRILGSQLHASSYGLGLDRALLPPGPIHRNPNTFYYQDRTHIGHHEELRLTCEALSHQVDPYTFTEQLFVPPGKAAPTSRIKIHVHASNLLRPVEKHVSLKIEEASADLEAEIMEVLLESLRG
jgi:rRNA-processing protein FCF1